MNSRLLHLTVLFARLRAVETVRLHRTYLASVLCVSAVLATVAGLRTAPGESEGLGVIYLIGLWAAAAPFCRSHIDEDVRLGYGTLWLQKPVSSIELYGARWLAMLVNSLVVTLSVTVAVTPAALAGRSGLRELLYLLAVVGWIPPLLSALNFTASAAGARNSALVAYGIVFMGASLPGLSDSLGLGAAETVLAGVLPPMEAMLDAVVALEKAGIGAGLWRLSPLLLYIAVTGLFGLALTLRVPARLGGRE